MLTLEQRVVALEKAVSRWRRLALGMLVILGVVGAVAATQEKKIPEVIRARKFVVVNEEGKEVGILRADKRGGWLEVRGAMGKHIATIGQGSEGGGLLLILDKDESAMFAAGTGEGGNGFAGVQAKKGIGAAVLGVSKQGHGLLKIYSKEADELIYAGAGKDGCGLVRITSKDGKKRVLRTVGDSVEPAASSSTPSGSAKTKLEARKAMRIDMTQAEVRSLFGEPDSVSILEFGPRWYYADLYGAEVRVYFWNDAKVSSWSGL